MNKKLPLILTAICIIAISIPALQQCLHFMKVKSLTGVVEPDTTKLSFSWWNRDLQKKIERYSTDSLSLNPACVRTRNQFEYTFFDKLNAHNIYEYNGVFFRMPGINYNERNSFVGFEKIRSHVKSLRKFQQHLKSKNIPLYVVIAASKFRVYRDQLPWWNKTTSTNTNYDQYKKELLNAGIPLIDANSWFIKEKDKHKASLMANVGVHWTLYGAALVYDSLLKTISADKKIDFERVNMKVSDGKDFYAEDMDVVNLANLSYPPKDSKIKEIQFPENKNPKRKLRPFVLADSFYNAIAWSPLNPQVTHDKSTFYYYYNTRYGLREIMDPAVNEAIVDKDLEQADCFILMVDVQNLEQFGFGFIEDYLQANKKF